VPPPPTTFADAATLEPASDPPPTQDNGTPAKLSPDVIPCARERVALGVAHRCGAAAMLLFLGGVAAAATGREYRPLLLGAFALGDVALAGAMAAWAVARRGGRGTREALGAGAFAVLWLAPSAVWLLIRRLGDD
jgi:hypothetical protein